MHAGGRMVSKDIIQLVREDHGRVRTLYRQYRQPGNTSRQRQLLALGTIRHSSMHSKREDMVLNPALAVNLGQQGSELMVCQRQHLEEALQQLLGLLGTWPPAPGLDDLLHTFMLDTEAHLRQEEAQLLPALAAALSQEQLVRLGQALEWAKLIAPSRPHPWTPKAPFFSHVANALLTLLDFVRDLLAFGGAPTL